MENKYVREKARAMAEVMLAYADGAAIEIETVEGEPKPWRLTKYPDWDWCNCEYRVAKKEHDFEPYTYETMMEPLGQFVFKTDNPNESTLVESVSVDFNKEICFCLSNGKNVSTLNLFSSYLFEGKKPCGAVSK